MSKLATLLSVAAVLVLVAPADAQIGTEIGGKAGVTFSTVDDPDFDAETLVAFGVGAYVRFALAQAFSIQPELLFMRKGAKQEFDVFDAEIKLDYIEVPVLARYDISTEGNLSPYLFAGPTFAFEVGCTVSDDEGDFDCDDEEDFETESFDIGATAGVGVGFAAGRGTFFIEGRYTFGFTDILASEEFESKNRSGAVMIGYGVPVGGR